MLWIIGHEHYKWAVRPNDHNRMPPPAPQYKPKPFSRLVLTWTT